MHTVLTPDATSRTAALLRGLRARILDGSFPSGSRLPTHRELERAHRAGRKTVEGALAALARDGFVEARGRAGTFVVAAPPHAARYGLVFPAAPGAERWTHFHAALRRAALAYRDAAGRRFCCYHGDGAAGTRRYGALLDEIGAHRLAGLVFTPTDDTFAETLLSGDRALPALTIGGSGPTRLILDLDPVSFMQVAAERFVAAGRRRVAALALGSDPAWIMGKLRPAWEAAGLTYVRRWVQSVNPGWEQQVVELLLAGPRRERPDGLLVLDDHLVPAVSRALAKLSVRVPRDLAVVAHANFPWPTRAAPGFERVGFDMREVLAASVALLDAVRRGVPTVAVVHLPARRAAEVEHG
jgi:DNA-binding LacI/PurR family transcriptional regulator